MTDILHIFREFSQKQSPPAIVDFTRNLLTAFGVHDKASRTTTFFSLPGVSVSDYLYGRNGHMVHVRMNASRMRRLPDLNSGHQFLCETIGLQVPEFLKDRCLTRTPAKNHPVHFLVAHRLTDHVFLSSSRHSLAAYVPDPSDEKRELIKRQAMDVGIPGIGWLPGGERVCLMDSEAQVFRELTGKNSRASDRWSEKNLRDVAVSALGGIVYEDGER